MSLLVIKKIIDKISGHVNNLILYDGGEPLLYKKIFEVIEYAKKFIPVVSFSTNGTLLTKRTGARLPDAGLSSLTISLDGLSNEYNRRIRGIYADKILKNVEVFSKDNSIPVCLTAVVTNDNIDSIQNVPLLKCRIP